MKHLVFISCLLFFLSSADVSSQVVDNLNSEEPAYVLHAITTLVLATVAAVIAVAMFIDLVAKPPRKRTSWLRKRNKQKLIV